MGLLGTDLMQVGELAHRLSSLQLQDFTSELNRLRQRYKGEDGNPSLPPFVLPVHYEDDSIVLFPSQLSAPNTVNSTGLIPLDLTVVKQLLVVVLGSVGATSQLVMQLSDETAVQLLPNLTLSGAAAQNYLVAIGPGCNGPAIAGPPALTCVAMPLPRFAAFFLTAGGVGNTTSLRIEGRR